jgi:hypothetical protein
MAHDPRVGEEARHVARSEARDLHDVEACEAAPECVALPEDREPGEARLEALQADLLEQAHIVRGGKAPLLVMVGEVLRSGGAPEAAELSVGAGQERGGRGRHGGSPEQS